MYDVDRILEIPIRNVAGRLGVEMKKRGKDMVANCLWHEDRRPSMVVGGKYNRCHCYSCGADYGVIDLVMKVRGVDFKDACEWLGGAPSKPPRGEEEGLKAKGEGLRAKGEGLRWIILIMGIWRRG